MRNGRFDGSSVTYDANGGTGTQINATVRFTFGSTVTVLGTGTITGRATPSRTGTRRLITAARTTIRLTCLRYQAANVTLYAQWTINTYTVTYDANGGTGTRPIQTVRTTPFDRDRAGHRDDYQDGLHLLALEHGR